MKAFPSVFVALLLLSLFSVDATLEETCKELAKPGYDINFDFCMTTLQVVPGSDKADNLGLTIIAANLTYINFTHNQAKAEELINDKNVSEEDKKSLAVCHELYDMGAYTLLNDVIKDLGSPPIDFDKLNSDLGAVWDDASTCNDTWNEGKQKSLMAKMTIARGRKTGTLYMTAG
ncbi:putative invertase inhibitor [Asparagus officinalis]|uniref:putative invertase inhibitor n=1 Tax=Asparagus officinalis TaxID=4686 RepID=UPI00098E4497|nr:putative invertase inhibitor [Asparagus officinalis]